ncbi:hypothetical protein SFC65_19010 [Priestia filamentosa]|uniref:hypothetical protein n=1 Tax=Priestia filamentosa TaxID=1402861 RepID=UPI003981EB9F
MEQSNHQRPEHQMKKVSHLIEKTNTDFKKKRESTKLKLKSLLVGSYAIGIIGIGAVIYSVIEKQLWITSLGIAGVILGAIGVRMYNLQVRSKTTYFENKKQNLKRIQEFKEYLSKHSNQ